MPTPQTGRIVKQTSPKASPVKTANKAAIARAFDNQSPTVKDRVKQWQQQGGGVKKAPEIFADPDESNQAKDSNSKASLSPKSKSASAKGKQAETKSQQSSPISKKEASTNVTSDAAENAAVDGLDGAQADSPSDAKQIANAAKKKEINFAKVRLAQAIVGRNVRPSERLRRISEARKEAAAAEAAAVLKAEKERKKELEKEKEREKEREKEEEKERAKTRAKAAAAAQAKEARIASEQKEAGTPKKRIISDGHWRSQRTPPNDPIPPPPPKPTVEGWLEDISIAPRPTKSDDCSRVFSNSDDGIRVTAISEADAQREKQERHEERRRKRRERADAKRAAYGRPLSSPGRQEPESKEQISGAYTEDTQSQPGSSTAQSSTTGFLSADVRTRRVNSHNRTRSAPTSVAPTRSVSPEKPLQQPGDGARTPPESHLAYSSGDDSDNITSISRRRPRQGGLKQKKNLFTHAAKLFQKPEPRLEPNPNLPAGSVRLPTIESWLDYAPDPFSDGNEIIAVEIPAPLNVRSRDQSPAIVRRSGESQPRGDRTLSGQESSDRAEGEDGDLKKRRLRRVIRHRDGTVTTEDADDPVDDVLSSPTLRRRGAQRQESPGVRRRPREQNSPPSQLGSVSTGSDASTVTREDVPDDISFVGRTRRPLTRVGGDDDELRRRNRDTKESRTMLSRRGKKSSSYDQERAPKHDGSRKVSSSSNQRKLAKHSDLISVLSFPTQTGTSIRSARSIRTYRSRLETATINDILHEFGSDEEKYMRELHTLVDGVVPVLLSSSLSSKSASATANMFHASLSTVESDKIAKPIFDIGIALDKLKSHHLKAPCMDSATLLTWAKSGVRYYKEYMRAWRAGFQDVVINLASQDASNGTKDLNKGMPRDNNGDVIDSNGERVDVAFLLRRPLVRAKYLAKTMLGINHVHPSSQAAELMNEYKELVILARNRSNEERARLEDEAAAAIDPTKARDPRTLEPVEGVHIAADRHVKARDTFDLELFHSMGQSLHCTIELTMRSDPPDIGNAGDLLVAELDGTGRWLLFPPLHVDQLSARTGENPGEIVIMVRGDDVRGSNWQELMLLTSEEEHLPSDWVQLLGSSPCPPDYTRSSVSSDMSASLGMEVPIGERAQGNVRRWKDTSESRMRKRFSKYSPSTILEESSTLSEDKTSAHEVAEPSPSGRLPRNLNEAMRVTGSPQSGLSRARAQRRSHLLDATGGSSADELPTSSSSSPFRATLQNNSNNEQDPLHTPVTPDSKKGTPSRYRRGHTASSDHQLPSISKKRHESSPSPSAESYERDLEWPITDTQSVLNGSTAAKPAFEKRASFESPKSARSDRTETKNGKGHRRTSSPLKHEYAPSELSDGGQESDASTVVRDTSSLSDSSSDSELDDDDAQSVLVPMSAIGRYRKAPRATPPESLADDTLSPSQSASQAPYREVPTSPSQGRKATATLFFWSDKGSWQHLWPQECLIVVSPGLIEAFEKPAGQANLPSSPPNSRPGSRKSSARVGEQLLLGLELTPLVPIRRGTALDISIRSPPTADSKVTTNTNNNFLFRSRSPEECEILYTLINHARINNPTYIALQNARAVSFNAQFQNDDRKDSKLSKASSWFGLGGRKNSYRASSAASPSISKQTDSSTGSMSSALSALRNLGRGAGRFNIARSTVTSRQGSGSNSLFTSSEGTGSSGGASIPSIFTNQPADASLGLNNCKIRFYLRETTTKWQDLGSARLTIMRPNNALNGGAPGVPAPAPVEGGTSVPIEHAGIENTAGHGVGMQAQAVYASLGNKVSASDKRIVVVGEARNAGGTKDGAWKTLLDVTLGESCFERVARTGIAVSVWENFEGGMVAKQGGVIAGRVRVYMMQFKNEADTAYTYSIVGKLRY